jgi:hypothetical protein
VILVIFIIVQGPKGEGMINSMNGTLAAGARSRTFALTLAVCC